MSKRVFFEVNSAETDSLHYLVSLDSNERKPEDLRVASMDALTLVLDSVDPSDLKAISETEAAKLSLEGVPVIHRGVKVCLVSR